MNLPHWSRALAGERLARRRPAGFTLSELLIAMALFTVLLGGLVGASLYGMRMFQAAELKANASDGARKGLLRLVGDIRSARLTKVGTFASGQFTEVAEGQLKRGNALQLFLTTDTNLFLLYYRDGNDNKLKLKYSLLNGAQELAHSVSIDQIFQAEDYRGNVLTNSQNNLVIRLNLEFFQTQYPVAAIGTNSLFDYYKFETCVTRRNLE
jgi:prepilin-type N-terminal cleavage/methylation domain-containing protein